MIYGVLSSYFFFCNFIFKLTLKNHVHNFEVAQRKNQQHKKNTRQVFFKQLRSSTKRKSTTYKVHNITVSKNIYAPHRYVSSKGHHLDNELISLNPVNLSCIQDYLSKYKTVRLLFEEYNITREYKQCSFHSFSQVWPCLFLFCIYV